MKICSLLFKEQQANRPKEILESSILLLRFQGSVFYLLSRRFPETGDTLLTPQVYRQMLSSINSFCLVLFQLYPHAQRERLPQHFYY